MGLGDAGATLAPWLRVLDDAQCLFKGDARGDGLASLQWRRSSPQERWLRLQIGEETGLDNAIAVEFLLLLDKLVACNREGSEQQLARWINGYAGYARSRYKDCCMGMCDSASRSPAPLPLSVVNPCSRHSDSWISDADTNRSAVGVVIECRGEFDATFFALLDCATANPYTTSSLSTEFRRVYRELEAKTAADRLQNTTIRLHVRLTGQELTRTSTRSLAEWMAVWCTRTTDSIAVVGVDMHSQALRDTASDATSLPFKQLLLCASSCASGYRHTPPTKTCDPVDDTTLRNIITKSQRYLQELELCNVNLASFACLTNCLDAGGCRLRVLRLREFAMRATSDGGIFTALKDTSHPLYHTLDELEIHQTMESVGGLSFWLEREAGEMLLANDRLARCVITQSCAIQPASTHRGFRQTRGRELRTRLPLASKLTLVSVVAPHLPRVLSSNIMEFAGHRTIRVAEMHYQIVDTDKLSYYVDDCKVWTRHHVSQVTNLPCGSYYF